MLCPIITIKFLSDCPNMQKWRRTLHFVMSMPHIFRKGYIWYQLICSPNWHIPNFTLDIAYSSRYCKLGAGRHNILQHFLTFWAHSKRYKWKELFFFSHCHLSKHKSYVQLTTIHLGERSINVILHSLSSHHIITVIKIKYRSIFKVHCLAQEVDSYSCLICVVEAVIHKTRYQWRFPD